MQDLIDALQILIKYETGRVINCEHDILRVCVDSDNVIDIELLEDLGFKVIDDEFGTFMYRRFVSC